MIPSATLYVAYYRVSTQQQGASGLGLEGQRLIAHRFLRDNDQIIAEYVEVESGRKDRRPELAKAIAHSRRADAILLVADLSRLARSVYFTAKLVRENVRFKACDLPNADGFGINIMASVAEKAATDISSATKRGLLAAKAAGTKLGNPQNFTNEHRALGAAATRRQAQEHPGNRQARSMARLLRAGGASLAQIAEQLNSNGFTTRHGKQFVRMSVSRLLVPLETEKPAKAGAVP